MRYSDHPPPSLHGRPHLRLPAARDVAPRAHRPHRVGDHVLFVCVGCFLVVCLPSCRLSSFFVACLPAIPFLLPFVLSLFTFFCSSTLFFAFPPSSTSFPLPPLLPTLPSPKQPLTTPQPTGPALNPLLTRYPRAARPIVWAGTLVCFVSLFASSYARTVSGGLGLLDKALVRISSTEYWLRFLG